MSSEGILRPVNLRTDLAPLADLIELVFAPTMDDGGRAAIREMRYLSRVGVGLPMISRLNEMAMGIKMGFVWIQNGQLVGNVSVYPAHIAGGHPNVWIIANVGVHPTYQRHGIARKLMQASLEMLAQKGNQEAILQVDYDNHRAIQLYESLGFQPEGAWTTWRRSALTVAPAPIDDKVFITRRRASEWQHEMHLAQAVRPDVSGGLGWQRPLTKALFRKSFWGTIGDWLTMNSKERLIVRNEDESAIVASLWVENSLGFYGTKMTLFVHSDYTHVANPLLNNAVRRFRGSSLSIEHPKDDHYINSLLSHYRFSADRTVYHMRLRV
jgi:ribosomal protein S18 acetylase RimI-like enzyme